MRGRSSPRTNAPLGAVNLWARAHALLRVFDRGLLIALILLAAVSLLTMYSASQGNPMRFSAHLRNLGIAAVVMWAVAFVPPSALMRLAFPTFAVGVALLVGVALFGEIAKGARRWLDLGFIRVQPSEMLKIAMPMMLAWYFHRREASMKGRDFAVAALLLSIPVLLVVRQPDLGTALLIVAAGSSVIFFAGISARLLAALGALGLAALPLLWLVMKDYQKQRVLTLLDPTADPLGKGFHIIQSTIAVGSGGLTGKGWMQGTQTHLDFIPEHTTDFILAVFAEEFGLVGTLSLIGLYCVIIGRGLVIAAQGATLFSRLLAAALSLSIFTYTFVNIGMVIGVLPVVGVPLPLMSYGGTAMVSLGIASGILMSISRHRNLIGT